MGDAPTIGRVRRALREVAVNEYVATLQSFFKTGPGEYGEGDIFIGVRLPAARAVARRFKDLALEEVIELLYSKIHEERLVSLLILVHQFKEGDEAHRERILKLYLANTSQINNWDLVDTSAPQIVGAYFLRRPKAELRRLARSPLVWDRRIAIVGTFTLIRAGEHDETMRLARVLLHDEHDLIRKAVGWMLREVGKRDEPRLVEFLERHAHEMPRVMLRYSLERLDAPLRKRFMVVKAKPV